MLSGLLDENGAENGDESVSGVPDEVIIEIEHRDESQSQLAEG